MLLDELLEPDDRDLRDPEVALKRVRRGDLSESERGEVRDRAQEALQAAAWANHIEDLGCVRSGPAGVAERMRQEREAQAVLWRQGADRDPRLGTCTRQSCARAISVRSAARPTDSATLLPCSPRIERGAPEPDLGSRAGLLELDLALAHRVSERRYGAACIGRRCANVEPAIIAAADAISEQIGEMIEITIIELLEENPAKLAHGTYSGSLKADQRFATVASAFSSWMPATPRVSAHSSC